MLFTRFTHIALLEGMKITVSARSAGQTEVPLAASMKVYESDSHGGPGTGALPEKHFFFF